ncbi:MAG: ABC transporter substrate-binding protein [Burkholderiales bacterium]
MSRTRLRRTVLAALACGLAAQAFPQPAPRVARVGLLASGTRDSSVAMVEQFRLGLAERGWSEGRDVVVDYRFAEGRAERLPALARELAALRPDVVVAVPAAAVAAMRDAGGEVPIVMANVTDPVGLGFVASIARPGGRVTGLAYAFDADVWARQLQLLREAVPAGRRLGLVFNPDNASGAGIRERVASAARGMNLVVVPAPVRRVEEFDRAFAALAHDRADMVLVLADPVFGSHAARMAQAATRHRLPTMHGARSNVAAGGLLFYGPNLAAQLREAADYVDRILKGAAPGALPVRQPSTFDLVVNEKAARELGLRLPPSLAQAANEVIR